VDDITLSAPYTCLKDLLYMFNSFCGGAPLLVTAGGGRRFAFKDNGD